MSAALSEVQPWQKVKFSSALNQIRESLQKTIYLKTSAGLFAASVTERRPPTANSLLLPYKASSPLLVCVYVCVCVCV